MALSPPTHPTHSAVPSATKWEDDRASYRLLQGEQETHMDTQDAAWHTEAPRKESPPTLGRDIRPEAAPPPTCYPATQELCVQLAEPQWAQGLSQWAFL